MKSPMIQKSVSPVIKWSGSKRKIAPKLALLFPNAEFYYDPFIGSGALLPFRPSKKGVAGDIVPELIALWKLIQGDPITTAHEYEVRWNRLQTEGHMAYYAIRDSFNTSRNPHDLLFLSRTCVNGLIRFNKNKEFNNSLHHTRPGINPERFRVLLNEWNIVSREIEFVSGDYRDILSRVKPGDFVFLDPPYEGTKGRYIPDDFNFVSFYAELERMNRMGVKWILTLDGSAGNRSYVTTIPSELYLFRLGLSTGNSPFTRLMKTSLDDVVESVYLNFYPPTGIINQIDEER